MDEKELERRLNALRDTWRVPGDAPLGPMWGQIEAEVFTAPADRIRRPWVHRLLPLAAVLALGVAIGQLAPPFLRQGAAIAPQDSRLASGPNPPGRPAGQDAPFVGVATDYLERVTALLVTLAEESRRQLPVGYSVTQAKDLLSTTRLLMDSPQATDPHLRELLDDLELVLAQIVRLPSRPEGPDVQLIDQTIDQRDVLPRLRGFLAENSSSQP
jgi:hypothetical protein